MNILVINCGSSTIKFQLIDVEKNNEVIAKGRCDMVGYKESNITMLEMALRKMKIYQCQHIKRLWKYYLTL